MKVPNVEHWAIITTEQIHIPGDDRSRTNPGHGYPEHTIEQINYESFTNYSDFEKAVERKVKNGHSFRAIQAIPLKVETKVSISINPMN